MPTLLYIFGACFFMWEERGVGVCPRDQKTFRLSSFSAFRLEWLLSSEESIPACIGCCLDLKVEHLAYDHMKTASVTVPPRPRHMWRKCWQKIN